MTQAVCFIFLLCGAAFAQLDPSGINPAVSTTSSLPRHEERAQRIFETFDGRQGDLCNQWVEPAFNGAPDCNTVPDSAATVLLPVTGSGHPFVALADAARTLILTGRGFISSQVATTGNAPTNFGTVNLATHRVTLSLPGRGCNSPDTTANMQGTATINSETQITVNIPSTWLTIALELEGAPRMMCYSREPAVANTWFYSGFKIGVTYPCDTSPIVGRPCPAPIAAANSASYSHLTREQILQRAARTTCCQGALGLRIGQCILAKADANGLNPTGPQACCGNAAIERSTERCCSVARGTTAYLNTPCPCSTSTATTSCPTGESCCLRTKYTELTATNIAANSVKPDLPGECFNSTTHQCCDTGMRFDPGTSQCCSINGVQSNNVPCPCANDFHCWGGQQTPALKSIELRCCMQTNNSAPWETAQCSTYANYPNGTGAYQNQRCTGACINPAYQICCNGVQCVREYEKCCNSTCCNRFTQTCMTGRRAGTPNNRNNFNDFAVQFETCSTIEQMSPLKAFWTILLPTILLATTFFATGLVLVFANKASSRSYAAIETAMINLALLAIIFSLVIFFSPAWKYSVVVVFVQLFTILTAASRIKKLNIWCLILQVVLVLYLVDPFHGNQFLTFASSRGANGYADRDAAGLVHLIGKMYKNSYSADPNSVSAFCTSFYLGFFAKDNLLRDTDRFDNPANTTFGYCDRSFILILLVFAALVLVVVFLQLILTLLALLLRFNKPQVKLVVREDYDEDYIQQ